MPRPRADVLDQERALRGAVRLPQLLPVDDVGRGDEKSATHFGEEARVRPGVRVRVNVLDHDRALDGPVAPPELAAVRAVVGREKHDPVDIDELPRKGALTKVGPDINVLEHRRAGGRAITLPKLNANQPHLLAGTQEYGPVDHG